MPSLSPYLKVADEVRQRLCLRGRRQEPGGGFDAKAIIAPNKLIDPAETAALTGKLHFDRITPEVKAALLTMLTDAKKKLLEKVDPNAPNQAAMKQAFGEVEKLVKRYLLLLGGADTAALRVNLDPATGDVAVEATLTPKPNTDLAKQIAARKPAENRFGGLITPDTVAGFQLTTPLFAEEIRNAFSAASGQQQKEVTQKLPEAAKDTIEELTKGQARTMKAGEGDMVVAVRGPDKDGHFSAVAAMSFENPAAVEKAFKKWMETDGPPEAVGKFKWNADKAGAVNIHTFTINAGVIPQELKMFGDNPVVAFAVRRRASSSPLGRMQSPHSRGRWRRSQSLLRRSTWW